MKAIRYILSLGSIVFLFFAVSGFTYGPNNEVLPANADVTAVEMTANAADPTIVLLLGIAFTIIGSFGCRKLIKK